MPPISSLLSTRSGSSGSDRAKDSKRRVSAAARVAPSIALLRWIITSRRGPLSRRRRKVDPPDDDREHVVEVVGDAAGQLADRLHLLDLAKLGFGGLALLGLGLERLVRLPQLLRAIADGKLKRFRALGFAFRVAARRGVLTKRLNRDHAEEDGAEPDDDPKPAQIIGKAVGLGREDLALLDLGAERQALAGDDFVELIVELGARPRPGRPGRNS